MWGLNRTTLRAAIRRLTEMGSLFFLTGIACDYNNVPVEFFKSVARPDMVRFSSILRSIGRSLKGDNLYETGSSWK